MPAATRTWPGDASRRGAGRAGAGASVTDRALSFGGRDRQQGEGGPRAAPGSPQRASFAASSALACACA